MSAKRLTHNQCQALHACVTGKIYGHMLTKTVPSLVKRGLMVSSVEEVTVPTFVPRAFGGPGGTHRQKQTVHRLTPEGFEAYEKMRTKWYKAKLATVETEYGQDMNRARSRTARVSDGS